MLSAKAETIRNIASTIGAENSTVISHTPQVRLKLRTARPAERTIALPGPTSPAAMAGTAKRSSGSTTTA